MPSRSQRDNADIASVTQRSKWPVTEGIYATEDSEPAPRVRTRRPRDPRKVKKIRVRPPRRNPLMGKGEPYRNERNLVYEPEEFAFEEEEE